MPSSNENWRIASAGLEYGKKASQGPRDIPVSPARRDARGNEFCRAMWLPPAAQQLLAGGLRTEGLVMPDGSRVKRNLGLLAAVIAVPLAYMVAARDVFAAITAGDIRTLFSFAVAATVIVSIAFVWFVFFPTKEYRDGMLVNVYELDLGWRVALFCVLLATFASAVVLWFMWPDPERLCGDIVQVERDRRFRLSRVEGKGKEAVQLEAPLDAYFRIAKNPKIEEVSFEAVAVKVIRFRESAIPVGRPAATEPFRRAEEYTVTISPEPNIYYAERDDGEKGFLIAKDNLPTPFLLKLQATRTGIYTISCSVVLRHRGRDEPCAVSNEFELVRIGINE